MTTTDREALYETATEAYNAAAEAQAARAPLGSRDTAPWRDGIRAVVDLVLDARPEPTGHEAWDCIRKTDVLIRGHWNFDGIDSARLLALAKDLEAEDKAAQEKAEREAAREKLIEQVARVTWTRRCPTMPWEDAMEHTRYDCLADARVLYDAGLLVAPETTDGGAA